MNTEITCFNCNKPLAVEAGKRIVKSEECPYCYADIRCCKMCKFYDAKSYNECKEPNAERVLEKEKANYCDYFALRGSDGANNNEKEDLLAAAAALFKS